MKNLLLFLFLISVMLLSPKSSYAIYDPLSTSNNKYGIHILFPEEISEAAHLVNSSGGEWGYVTIPIRISDRNIEKWQKFLDDSANYKVIPLIRLATEGDYFNKASWEKPNKYSMIDFANFLSSLNWPTKNRYIIVLNEPNRGDEWGGIPNPQEYADILNYAVDVFKKRDGRFFIIGGGLDNAAPDVYQKYISQFNYLREMNQAVPGIFERIDGLSVHAYPNPGFSSTPEYRGVNGIYSYEFEKDLIANFTDKNLPVFITETGWTTESTSHEAQVQYYKRAFENAWSDKNIVAVTPFLLHSEGEPFRKFSFILDNKRTPVYEAYAKLPKIKGTPQIEPKTIQTAVKSTVLKTRYFTQEFTKTIYNKINDQTTTFLRWLLHI
ncbi:MAG: cellulase family glycosylhydrolase [Candidatus Levybacteria bacterium]|nr:cellulase family glycosylhydrolase [Candidatus Levybacteria bacterium]